MRKLVLSAFILMTLSTAAMAQFEDGAVVVSGAINDGEGPITITVNPATACFENAALTGWPTAAMHGSIATPSPAGPDPATNVYGLDWDGTKQVDWNATSNDNESADFVANADGSFSKTLTPRTYFRNVTEPTIAGIAFVVNGGSNGDWAHSARAYSSQGATTCTDFKIPFPVPATLTGIKANTHVSNLSRQNSPNPFNGSTTIEYAVRNASDVTMKVYNVYGQEVTTLVSGHVVPGTYSADFNGNNVAPGVYFYTTTIGKLVDTKRMLVTK